MGQGGFHLHTAADKEFRYSGDSSYYHSNCFDALAKAGIRLGVITNHNKFDLGEFKALRSAAKKKGIALLPGVELSVSEGSNGIHTLVVFSEEWLAGRHPPPQPARLQQARNLRDVLPRVTRNGSKR